MRYEIVLPNRVRRGEPVSITIRITNQSTEPAPIEFTGRPIAFDILIDDASGRRIWQRLSDDVVGMVLQVRILEPGESLELLHMWDQSDDRGAAVSTGTYTVRGILPTPDGDRWLGPNELVIV